MNIVKDSNGVYYEKVENRYWCAEMSVRGNAVERIKDQSKKVTIRMCVDDDVMYAEQRIRDWFRFHFGGAVTISGNGLICNYTIRQDLEENYNDKQQICMQVYNEPSVLISGIDMKLWNQDKEDKRGVSAATLIGIIIGVSFKGYDTGVYYES